MKNSHSQYLSRLDHLRFFASVIVIVFHFVHRADNYYQNTFSANDIVILWIINGKIGVTLFLVLSGFLFTYLAKAGEKKILYGKFLLNRVLRIYPLLTLIFLAIICIDRQNSSPMDVLRLFLLQLNTGNPGTGWGNHVLPVGVIWTIAVEFQFYLLFPILMQYVHKNGYLYLFGLIGFINILKTIIIIYAGDDMYFNLYHSTIGRLDQFLIGIIAGGIYIKNPDLISSIFRKYGLFIIIITLILFTLIFKIEYGAPLMLNSMPGFLVEAILWVVIIFSYMHIKLPIGKNINKFLCACGERSYSIYLLHYMLGETLLKFYKISGFDENTNALLNIFLLVIPITLIVSDISYRFVERPFMAMRVSYFK